MTDHPGLDEVTAQRAARSEAELRQLAALLPSIPFYLAPESMSVVMAWAAGEIDALRAEVATLRENAVAGGEALRGMARKVTEWRRYSVGRDEKFDRQDDLIHNIWTSLDAFGHHNGELDDDVEAVVIALDDLRADLNDARKLGDVSLHQFENTVDMLEVVRAELADQRVRADHWHNTRERLHSEIGAIVGRTPREQRSGDADGDLIARVRAELSTLRDGRVPGATADVHKFTYRGYCDGYHEGSCDCSRSASRKTLRELHEWYHDHQSQAPAPAPSVPLDALRALAQGEPLDEVAGDYGVPLDVVKAAAPLVGRTDGVHVDGLLNVISEQTSRIRTLRDALKNADDTGPGHAPEQGEPTSAQFCAHHGDDNYFDRTLCAPPCDTMHTRCTECHAPLESCAHSVDDAPVSASLDPARELVARLVELHDTTNLGVIDLRAWDAAWVEARALLGGAT